MVCADGGARATAAPAPRRLRDLRPATSDPRPATRDPRPATRPRAPGRARGPNQGRGLSPAQGCIASKQARRAQGGHPASRPAPRAPAPPRTRRSRYITRRRTPGYHSRSVAAPSDSAEKPDIRPSTAMVAKLVVFVAFVALAHGMVRREASTQSPLQEVEKHAAEFQKTITEQWSALLNSKNTQAVNKALKEGSDSISDANGKAKEALETTRANLEKAAAELRKAHPEVEQQAGQLRDRLQAAVSTGVAETQKLAQEVAAHVDQANTKLAPQIKQAYDDFTKQVEVVQKKLHEAANKPQ
ncbi:hypothetical protein MSG28_005483 [Choristoneura fumiferana]|uniref:Uncharacterized protein n=1 Tax=Choristoneura fumiferana TaxID=7141 RepID=A0ACC0L052_CHOFU|nr:hypothetical protein MSG28_005483 [Choristoneura fumiferana]